jgi:Cu-Zn family superoxide dismutase
MSQTKPPIQAIAVFTDSKIKGQVIFTETPQKTIHIDINLSGLNKNAQHGFHVHESGDLSDGCTSMCSHFNPYKKKHGGPHSKERHVGDLGNIQTDKKGNCQMQLEDDQIKLRGTKCNIVGRGLIIHENPDDLGQGPDEESTKTGNAGKRIACAVIGYSKTCKI